MKRSYAAPRTRQWARPNSSQTCAAPSPTSASSCASTSDAHCRRRGRKRTAVTDMLEKPHAGTRVGSQIGRSLPRTESRDKVTGRGEYVHTMRLPGMLVAKLFRSTLAHGRIKAIHTSAARKLPGVLHVVTIDDVKKVLPDPYYGPAFHDQPI